MNGRKGRLRHALTGKTLRWSRKFDDPIALGKGRQLMYLTCIRSDYGARREHSRGSAPCSRRA